MTKFEKQLYPIQRHNKDKSGRRWHVKYNLAYEGGGFAWTGYYRTRFGASIASWWHVHVVSWGGSAELYKNEKE